MEAAPKDIGAWRILEALGQGAMGVVYLAEHRDTGLPAALKTVRVPHESMLSGIRREVHALGRLQHPGIVRILDEGVAHGLPWYAMELLSGSTLGRHVAALGREACRPPHAVPPTAGWWTVTLESVTSGTAQALAASTRAGTQARLPPPPPGASARQAQAPDEAPEAPAAYELPEAGGGALGELLSLARSLCSPLAYLHGEGLVHRDLKPANILVRSEKSDVRSAESAGQSGSVRSSLLAPHSSLLTPVIVDFGLTQQFGQSVSREVLDVQGGFAGTAAYMAPEQIRGELLDARADLYSLGCILFELVTGRKPFAGAAVERMLWQHLHEPPPRPSSLARGVPPELDELILSLLEKSPARRIGHAGVVSAALAGLGAHDCYADSAQLARAYLYRPGFSGREPEMARLERRLAELRAGRGGLLLLGGESGAGKTRLLLEAGRRALRDDLLVLSGECAAPSAGQGAGGGEDALHALRRPLQRLADLCREAGPRETERIFGARGSVLAAYEPALASLPGHEPAAEAPGVGPAAAQQRLYEALSASLIAFADREPLLLVLDDLQWADELTLGWLQSLQQATGPCPFLVLGAYRSEELGPALQALLGSGGEGLALGRLDETAVGRMVGDMLALEPPPRLFVSFLTRHSEGSPFFVAEYLRAAVDEGLLFRDREGRWQVAEPGEEAAGPPDYEALPLPLSLRELVRRRLDDLPPCAAELVHAAAVLGREMPAHMLWMTLRLGLDELHAATEEVLRRQILEPGEAGTLRFVHDKIREVAYEGIGLAELPELHLAAAGVLDALLPDEREEHVAELGHHWQAAGELEKARECYLAGAVRARVRFALAESARLYRLYLALVDGPDEQAVRARNVLARAVLDPLSRPAEAVDELRRALADARSLGSRRLEASTLRNLSILLRETGLTAEALTLVEEALSIFRELGDSKHESWALSDLALVHYKDERYAEAERLYQQSLELARSGGDLEHVGTVTGNLGILYHNLGRLEAARDMLVEARRLDVQTKQRSAEAIAVSNLGLVLADMGEVEAAREAYETALGLHRELGHRRTEAITASWLARLERRLGNIAAAERLLARADELGSRENLLYSALLVCDRGHLRLAQGLSAAQELEQAEKLSGKLQLGHDSELGRNMAILARAQAAFEAGEAGGLFRGDRIDEIPEGLRRWLKQRGDLA
jgi:serine/threonine protein kinase/predicted ATPase